jgi:hypothetical protein
MHCLPSTPATPLLFIYLLPRSWPPYIPAIPRLLVKPSSSGCGPGWASGKALALALAPTLSCASALLRPGPVLLLKLKLLAQAQGCGHHLPSHLSAKLLALASRWPLLLAIASRWPFRLAPPSRQSIPARQFVSTSPQSSWTILAKASTNSECSNGQCYPSKTLLLPMQDSLNTALPQAFEEAFNQALKQALKRTRSDRI